MANLFLCAIGGAALFQLYLIKRAGLPLPILHILSNSVGIAATSTVLAIITK